MYIQLQSKKYADIIIPNYGGGYSASFQEESKHSIQLFELYFLEEQK